MEGLRGGAGPLRDHLLRGLDRARLRGTCAATIATDLRAAGVDTIRTQAELATAGALPPGWGTRRCTAAPVRAGAQGPRAYAPLFPDVPDDLPYHWPVAPEATLEAERRRAEGKVRREARALEKRRLEAERQHRARSRAATKAWQTRRRNAAVPPGERP